MNSIASAPCRAIPSPKSGSDTTVFVGRQPVYNRDRSTWAYELLFRSSETNQANFVDGERATAELLLNTFAEIGLERIVGNRPALINVSEEFIVNGHCNAFPKDRVVIEVLEDVRPTRKVVTAITNLKAEGYTIALDDFVSTNADKLLPLVELADIVKVDLPQIPAGQLPALVESLRKFDLRILAEKIETLDEFETCKALGFDYYQGYFFSRPTVIKGKKISVSRVTTMQLVSKLQDAAASLEDISEIIQTEPALAYKLLRYVNSAYYGLTHRIESIKHAAAYAGMRQIKTICALSLVAQVAEDKPGEFVNTMLVRAKMCELLAVSLRLARADSFFMVGLFSALDTLLDVPMSKALKMVSVSKEVEEAITMRSGPFGMVLNCVLHYEQGNWSNVSCGSLENGCIRSAYLKAIDWAKTSMSGLAHSSDT